MWSMMYDKNDICDEKGPFSINHGSSNDKQTQIFHRLYPSSGI